MREGKEDRRQRTEDGRHLLTSGAIAEAMAGQEVLAVKRLPRRKEKHSRIGDVKA